MNTHRKARNRHYSDQLSVDALRLSEVVKSRGGTVLKEHEAALIAAVLDNLCARAGYLYSCMEVGEVPTQANWQSFLRGYTEATAGEKT